MSLFWTLIGICVAIIWVITLVDLFRRHLGAGPTAGWLIIVILLPFIGALVYWIVRKPSSGDVEETVEARQDIQREGQRPMPPPP